MSEERRCRECGTPIPSGVRHAFCPRCLLGLGLSAGAEVAAGVESPPGQLPNSGGTVRCFGDYELLEEIARGGMGVVWRAWQISLARPVALKLILAGELASEAAIERFHREAQAAANLDHPNIVPIYEVGEHAGWHYFTMRLVEGQSLARRIGRSGRKKPQAAPGCLAGKAELPEFGGYHPREAAKLLVKIARAVHHAHQRGVLHRDLKPGNILLDAAGEPHITDFGLAKRVDAPGEMTRSETVVGTCNFMSPEQAQGRNKDLTTATDIYSLGAVLYDLLTGRPPFEGPTSWETLRQVVEREPCRPSALNRLLDRDLETICLKCLEKDPQRRYASADALANDLEHWLRQEPIRARPSSTWEHVAKWTRRKPAVAGLIGALAIVAILGMLAVLWYAREANHARLRAQGSEADARERLWNSYLAQARALRWSGRPGHRFDSLAAISNAAAMHPTPELRREAIACLGLCDVQIRRRWRLEPKPPPLWGVAFDNAFERYARAHPKGDLSLHRINDDVELARLPGVGQRDETALCFSPNGRFLAEAQLGPSTNCFRVWDLGRRMPVVWAPYAVSGAAIGFAADSSIVAAGEPGAVHVHDLRSGQELQRISASLRPNALSLDSSQRRLAVCGNRSSEVLIFDPATGSLLKTLPHPSEVTWLAWSPHDVTLACACMDKRVYLWNALTGDRIGTLEGHTGCVVGVAFNRGGDLLISSSWDGSTRFWNPATGEQLLSVPLDFARFVPFSADDHQLCLLESDDLPSVWDVAPGRECRRWPVPSTLGATFCAGGRVLIGIAPDSVRFWDAADGHPLGSLPVGHCASIFLQPDGRSLWLSGPCGLLRYSLEFDPLTAEIRLGPAQHLWESALGQASFSLDGQTLAAACPDRPDVLLLNLQDPAQPRFLQGHAGATFVALSPDARWLATGPWNGPSVKVWEVASGRPVRELPFEGPALVSFTPDGGQLITGNTFEYRIWATGSWESMATVPRHNARSTAPAMALAPDGRTVALLLGREEETQVYALPSLRPLASFDEGSPLCFSPDGAQFATFDNQAKRVLNWDLRQIREELAAMRLDWEAPPLAPRPTSGPPAKLHLTIASP